MPKPTPHRKLVKHFHEPGDLHELTFCCYRRMQLLGNNLWWQWLARSIDEAAREREFHLVAFVFMPEHVHLLVRPIREATAVADISRFLAAVKRPVSRQVKARLEAVDSPLLKKLTIRTRPGCHAFRFWQEGPGYDRNLQSAKAVSGCIDYLHLNPVKRKLVTTITQWKWSSARWYASDGQEKDPDLPTLRSPPDELFR